ncbi:MAG: nucleoside/nucleotide kinase family protein [Oscillospiraceae bacterium]|nr:nucleoside/nucleotide kinase family protein [Oscillospiraceae bacterium]
MGDGMKTYSFNVNSFEVKAKYHERDISDIFVPLILRLDEMRQNAGRRIVVYLAGPCGAGKTTMSLLLESLAPAYAKSAAQAVGMDGFHYKSEYLKSNYIKKDGGEILMQNVKGSAETYDFEKLREKIAALKTGDVYWPGYDRLMHDVVEDAVFVCGQIVIIEGNWLLLDEPRWRGLIRFCDYSIFIGAAEKILIRRLTERKIMGGMGEREAIDFVMRSDAENIGRILGRRAKCDLELQMAENGRFAVK